VPRRLVVFDLDGTLVDSRHDLARSANLLLETLGAPPLDEAVVTAMVGEGARLLVQRVLASAGVDADLEPALERFLAIYDEHLLDATRPYPGVPEALGELAGRAGLGVLTNKPQRPAEVILRHFDLARHFAEVVGGGGTWPRKPAPDALLAMIGHLGATAAETLFVGDSWIDLETARAAGVRVCLVRYGFGFAQVGASRLRGDEWFADHPRDWLTLV
jgi:phosphoglycolate phosphatase